MPRKPNPKPDNAEQSKRFLETAKALGLDKTGDTFKRALDVVVPLTKKKAGEKR